MTNVQSKLLQTASITCKEFNHPWTNDCVNASAGLLLAAIPYCLRVYTVVYALSLLMRHRVPTWKDLRRTLDGIIQSTAFLVTNSFTFIMYNCLIRHLLGCYHASTVAFIPSFMASFTAILVERPARRPLLTLYVANVATEALWNMAVARGFVKSLPHGQTIVFGLSVTTLLYMYRLGLHKNKCKDSIFNILRLFVDKTEEGPIQAAVVNVDNNNSTENLHRNTRRISFTNINSYVQIYSQLIEKLKCKHISCLHKESCLNYCLQGGLKPFVGGIGLQIALKIIMNIHNIIGGSMNWRSNVFNKKTLGMGAFLGGFSLVFKSMSCIFRHSFGYDDARFVIPAGFLASVTFSFYPDNTVALYVFWKMLQILYNYGADLGKLPVVPGFMLILYSLCTALLFHCGILEPKTLRPSYLKFLQAISGERLSKFNTSQFNGFGFNTTQSLREVIEGLKVLDKSALPKFALAS